MPLTPEQQFQAYYDELVRRVAQAKANLATAQADLGTAQAELDRVNAAIIAAIEASQPPPEPIKWTLAKRIDKRADWNTILTPAPGSSITDTAEGMRFRQPNNGERCEGQIHRPEDGAPQEGELWAMEWEFRIDSTLSTADPRGYNLISQLHADNAGGFTGGIVVTPLGLTYARLKGGDEYDLKGSHSYEYEDALDLGTFSPGWNRVRIETDWSSWYQARLNGGAWSRVEDKPIWPKGNADGDPSDVIMVRLGWYPHQGRVPEGGLDMTTRNAGIYRGSVV